MKKILIIAMILALTLSYKVKAMSLDGTLIREDLTGPNEYQFNLYDIGLSGASGSYVYQQAFNFTTPIVPNGGNYAVFPIDGITYSEGVNINNFMIKVYLMSDSSWAMCEIQNNLITCGLNQNITYTGIFMWLRPMTQFSSSASWNVEYKVNAYASIYKTDTQSIIDNNNQNYNNFMETNSTYDDQINTNMNGANETIEYNQQEQQLLDSLDINTTMLDNLYVNSSANSFIWDIVGGLRSMNPAIITLMSTMLALGIVKMVLGR